MVTENITADVLVYDIETKTFGNRPDPQKDKLRLFGCYSYKTKKHYILTSKEQIQQIINAHKFLVGYNTDAYDSVVLKREGISFEYKMQIDLYVVVKERAGVIKIKEGILKDVLMEFKLDYVTRKLGLVTEEEAKKKIDYNLFKKDSWTPEEIAIIKDYVDTDVDITRRLYEWIEDFFVDFRDLIRPDDVAKKQYLRSTSAKVGYKAINKEMGWEDKYGVWGTASEDDEDSIAGGYVSYPSGEEFHSDAEGSVYLMDFQSEYPHAMMMANLYGRKKEGEVNDRPTWSGGGVWKVEGVYYADTMHPVGQLIKRWFNERLELKKLKNRKEYSLKIILNILYGILNNPYYVNVYDLVAGADCTRLGRQWVRYGRKVFRDKGYKVIYTDTDSIYVKDPFNDEQKVIDTKNEITDYIKSTVPFPQDTYTMVLEAQIKHMFFFKGKNISEKEDEMDEDDFLNRSLSLMKKNYIYVTTDGKLEIKNLGIRKKSNSPVSRKIFWEDLVPQMVKDGKCKFSKTYILQLMKQLVEKDLTLATLRKDVKPLSEYSKSMNGLQAQISAKYGDGIFFFIPNKKGVGVGKGSSYCTVEEYHSHKMRLDDIDWDYFLGELDYFIKAPVTKNIFQF